METDSKEKDLFNKLCRYCAYRERAVSEVLNKMNSLEIPAAQQLDFILHLKAENYLNEKRFAESLVRGKFKHDHWGRNKIRQALKAKRIKTTDVNVALNSIDEEEYFEKIRYLISKKNGIVKDKNLYTRKKKIVDYLMRKGFESALVWEVIREEGLL